jgi:hypothetical protein
MAQQKRRNPVQRQQRSWTIPRFLLVIGYGLVFAFLGTLFLMRQELLRVGIFGDKPAAPASVPPAARPWEFLPRTTVAPPPQVTPEVQRPAPAAPPQMTTEALPSRTAPPASTTASPRHSGEITTDEKQALDDILRSKR